VTHTVSNPSSQQLRHRCRNPRCRSKLPAPVENLYAAFCTLGCWNQFHRQRCVVCERLFRRATENQLTCGRRKCRLELRRQTALYLPFQAGGTLPTLDVNAPHGSAHSTGLKTRLTGDRPWRIVAGPALPEINLQIPLEPEVIARLVRVHADYLEYERKRHWHTARAAQIKRRHPPVNVLGGFRFPDVPAVELGPVKTPESEWAVPSRWKPTGDGADIPDTPHSCGAAPAGRRRPPPSSSHGGTRSRRRGQAHAERPLRLARRGLRRSPDHQGGTGTNESARGGTAQTQRRPRWPTLKLTTSTRR
jgi:hypothetical protein